MSSPRRTVLVVDDDPAIRMLCRINLELDGWSVREAGSLADARAELRVGDVAVVFLDVHVGDESGGEFLDELRRDYAATRVALLTGSVGAPGLDGLTPDAVITKPFTLESLAETVQTLAR